MLINLKALSEAKIFKKKKNSEARETSQTFRLIHNALEVKNPSKNWKKISVKIEPV